MQLQETGIRNGQNVPDAFIIYSSGVRPANDEVFANGSARAILSYQHPPAAKKLSAGEIITFCRTWKDLFEKKMAERAAAEAGPGEEAGPCFIDIIESGRRRYIVRGAVLAGLKNQGTTEEPGCHLFVFERFCAERVNVSRIAQLWHLNRREEEIVRLLLSDCSNKEIAGNLNLSLNTVKVYLKLLMRKLGVSSRVGIVACILTREPAGL